MITETFHFKNPEIVASHLKIQQESEDKPKSNWTASVQTVVKIASVIFGGVILGLALGSALVKLTQDTEDNFTTWKVKGSQDIGGFSGDCDAEEAHRTFEVLQKNNPSPHVAFEKSYLTNYISRFNGGTCSAMSLDFADNVYTQCPESKDQIDCIKKIASKYQTSGKQFRNRQAAFNAITVTNPKQEDLVREKMSSLASFYGFNITDRVSSFHDASPGVFLGRAIKPKDNHKLEAFGHSIVFVKLPGDQSVMYDPNTGTSGISNENLHQNVETVCAKVRSRWNLEKFSFFRLEKKEPPLKTSYPQVINEHPLKQPPTNPCDKKNPMRLANNATKSNLVD